MYFSFLYKVANIDEAVLMKTRMKSKTECIQIGPVPWRTFRVLWTRIGEVDHQVCVFDRTFALERENLS